MHKKSRDDKIGILGPVMQWMEKQVLPLALINNPTKDIQFLGTGMWVGRGRGLE
jgi:hypothetical protein